MKKQNLIMLLILVIGIQKNLSAQFKDKLCYTTTERTIKKIPHEVEINKLATHEILSTRIVTVQKEYTETVDDKDNYATNYKFIYHKNYFPDWYLVPDETVIDENGITNYFTTTTTLYDGGWQGHNYEAEANNSEYLVDLKGSNPQKKYSTYYTPGEFTDYDNVRNEVIKHGIIKQFIFNPPSQDQRDHWVLLGYNVVVTSTMISVSNGEVSMEWNLIDKTITIRIYEGTTVVTKEVRYYVTNTEIGEDLISTVENTEYITLTTGDCGEEFSTTDYEFNLECSELGNRNKMDKKNQVLEAKLYPNPARDNITVDLNVPRKSQKMEVIIYDQIGSTVLRKVMNPRDELSIDISSLQPGFYSIGINVDNQFKSLSFVKQ